MNSNANKILSFIVGALLTAAVFWLVWPTHEVVVPNEATDWSRLSDRAIEENLKDASLEEVKRFVKAEMDMELPANFVIPAYIANARNSGDAVRQVNREYPVFSGEKGDDFLRAVQKDPIRYREYLYAHKAIRKRFKTN